MLVLDKIVFSKNEPSVTTVLWAKPVGDSYTFYLFDGGKWNPLQVVNSQGTPTINDDTPWEGGSGSSLGPNTVGSREIIDGSVMLTDLNREVTDRLEHPYDSSDEALYIDGAKPE